jgi:hypothetical protein
MFNRGGRDAEGPVSVEIILEGGRELSGKLIVPPGRTLAEVLNGGASFIEFRPAAGDRTFIAKAALRSVRPTSGPPAPDLWAGPAEGGNFDPFAILGIKPGTPHEQVRDAYLRMAKVYHPYRYAAADLPREVHDYLSAMVRRINAAYDAVQAAQRKPAAKDAPVFTKAGS